jgi:hypothetical protein
MDFTESATSGANQITTAAGSTNKLTLTGGDFVDSRGTDTITTDLLVTSGTVSGTAGIDTSGNDQWTVKGTATINGRATASPFVTLMSGASLNVTGQLLGLHLTSIGGTATVDTYQASATGVKGGHISWSVTGGSSSSYIWNGETHIQTTGGAQGSTVRLGDGKTEVISYGKDKVWAGAGDANVILGGGGAELYAGTGKLTVFGRSLAKGNEAKVYGNGGSYTFDGDSGNILYYGGDKASTVNLKLSFMTLTGGAGKMTVNGGTAERIIGGSGGLDYTAGVGGNAGITTAAGSTNILRLDSGGGVDSWGNDTIIGGRANDTITVHGNASITGGTGLRTITLMSNDTFTHAGSANVTLTKGADATVNIAGNGNITETDATLRVSVGGANASSGVIKGGSAQVATRATGLSVTTSLKGATDIALIGPATVTTNGADTLHAGSGLTTVYVGGANATIYGGSGTMNLRHQGSGALGMKFIGGSGDTSMLIFNGTNDVVFGSGKTTVNAQGGVANTYEFVAGKGGGTDIIQGFKVGVDHMVLQGVSVTSQTVSGGSASIVLSDNTHLQLMGVSNLSKVFV